MPDTNANIEGVASLPGTGPQDDKGRLDVTTDHPMEINDRNEPTVVGEVRVSNRMGLHARPAMQLVDLASKFASRVRVCKDRQCVNAKSIMELLLLAAAEGTTLTIQAEGPDAHEAVEALTKLVESKFDEE